MERKPMKYRIGLAVVVICGSISCGELSQTQGQQFSRYGQVELDFQSKYSHIRVRKVNNQRTLMFVRDSGEEVIESLQNLKQPHRLLAPYTRFMFQSYLFQPTPSRVLIVGLGGGSMVHFLKKYDPKVVVDVVEIDPAIVTIADKYFNVRTKGNVTIYTEDAFKYLAETKNKYDVIYMDAFLKPTADTDSTGIPLRLKTTRFYKGIQQKLNPNGLVVYNLNSHPKMRDDISVINDSFPQTYEFHMGTALGSIVVGSIDEGDRVPYAELKTRSNQIDRRLRTTFSFRNQTLQLVQ